MSFQAESNVKCPCGEEFEASLWSSVNAGQHPELRDEILAGQLNVVRCSICTRMVYAERFVLYHDPAAELMAFVYPTAYADDKPAWRRRTEQDFRAAQEGVDGKARVDYPPLTLFGMDELVELIKEEQEFTDEGDILENIAPRLELEVARLKPSRARRDRVPPRLPLVRGPGRKADRLRQGIAALLAANDRLEVYAALRKRLSDGALDAAALLDEKGK